MKMKTVVILDEQERLEVLRLLPSLALAFTGRDDERAVDFELWKTVRRLGHPDSEFDERLLNEIQRSLEVALDRLGPGSSPDHWRRLSVDTTQVPGSTPVSEVLAEAAQVGFRAAGELKELVDSAQAACRGLPALV
jgi:hypothetical protein